MPKTLIACASLAGLVLFLVPIMWLVAPCLLAGWWMTDELRRSRFRGLLIAAFGLAALARVVGALANTALAFELSDLTRPWDLVPDAAVYNSFGYYIAECVTGRLAPPYYKVFVHAFENLFGQLPAWYSYQVTGMAYWEAALFGTFSTSPLAVKLCNGLFNLVVAFLIYRYGRRPMGEPAAVLAALAVLWHPSLWLWSVSGAKEWPVILGCFTYLLLVANLFSRRTRFRITVSDAATLAGLALSGVVVYYLRQDLVLILLAIAGIMGAAKLARLAWVGWGRVALIAAGVAVAFAMPPQIGRVNDLLDRLFIQSPGRALSHYAEALESTAYQIYPERLYDWSTAYFHSQTADAEVFTMTFDERVLSVIRAVLRCWFSPFLSDLTVLRSMWVLFPLTILHLALAPFVVLGALRGLWRHAFFFAPFLLYLILLTLALGLHSGNVGTVFRLKDMMMPAYLMFAALGLSSLAGARKTHAV